MGRFSSKPAQAPAPAPVPPRDTTRPGDNGRATAAPPPPGKPANAPAPAASGPADDPAGDIGWDEPVYDEDTLAQARLVDSWGLDGFALMGLKRPESEMSEFELLSSGEFDDDEEDEDEFGEKVDEFDRLFEQYLSAGTDATAGKTAK